MTSFIDFFDFDFFVAVLLYMVPGVLCGIVAAVASRDRKNPFAWTLFAGLVLVPPAAILGVGIGGFLSGIQQDHPDLVQAAVTGLIACFLFGVYSPILCWIPVLCVGLPVQASLQCAGSWRQEKATRQFPPQFSLRKLMCLSVVGPPLLAAWYYRPAAGTAIVVAIFATQILVHIAVWTLEPE